MQDYEEPAGRLRGGIGRSPFILMGWKSKQYQEVAAGIGNTRPDNHNHNQNKEVTRDLSVIRSMMPDVSCGVVTRTRRVSY